MGACCTCDQPPAAFRTGWQAAYDLGALCWALFFFGLAAAALVSGHESPARPEGPNLASPDWLFVLVFDALVLMMLALAGLYAWRVFGKAPALIVGDDAIHLNGIIILNVPTGTGQNDSRYNAAVGLRPFDRQYATREAR